MRFEVSISPVFQRPTDQNEWRQRRAERAYTDSDCMRGNKDRIAKRTLAWLFCFARLAFAALRVAESLGADGLVAFLSVLSFLPSSSSNLLASTAATTAWSWRSTASRRWSRTWARENRGGSLLPVTAIGRPTWLYYWMTLRRRATFQH